MTETIRRPLMSGHCSHGGVNPTTGMTGHERCHMQGGGQRANPQKEFQPCPCPCHYVDEETGELLVYECGACGRDIVAAPLWPYDEEGDIRYTHLDEDSRAIGEDCPVSGNRKAPASGADEPEPEPEPEPEQPAEPVGDDGADDEFADLDDLDALLADL